MGYILEAYYDDKKIDAQVYEPVEDGRHIITLDLSKGIKMPDCQKGIVYEFSVGMHKAPLSKKTVEFLKKGTELDAIYRFELQKRR